MNGASEIDYTQLNSWELNTCNYVCRSDATRPKCALTQCKDSACETCVWDSHEFTFVVYSIYKHNTK